MLVYQAGHYPCPFLAFLSFLHIQLFDISMSCLSVPSVFRCVSISTNNIFPNSVTHSISHLVHNNVDAKDFTIFRSLVYNMYVPPSFSWSNSVHGPHLQVFLTLFFAWSSSLGMVRLSVCLCGLPTIKKHSTFLNPEKNCRHRRVFLSFRCVASLYT